MSLQMMKPCLREILIGVDFLHTQAGVVHTGVAANIFCEANYSNLTYFCEDIQPRNLLLSVDDMSMFRDYEEAEQNEPSARKILDDRVIYRSRGMPLTNGGLPLICNFGEARFTDEEHDHDVMPNQYRAPDVTMHMKWNYKVDTWSIAMVVSKGFPKEC